MLKESDVEVVRKIVSVCVQLKISVKMMLMKHTLKKLQAFLPLTPKSQQHYLDIVCFYFQANAFWDLFWNKA